MSDIKYLDPQVVEGVRLQPIRRTGRMRQDGYGTLMPTDLMLRIHGKERRLRLTQWSNSGTHFVSVRGEYVCVPNELVKELYARSES